ncbi:MAG TPA: energy-coupling factor transporter ATPase [Anaerolineales bacterium]|nr:energy-coupling factor transporter ATPase [Anaerolineales bacterium]
MTSNQPATDKPLVKFDQVTYQHYGKPTPALVDINLTVRRGSFTLLVGPSGSGKSTLCMLLNGIIPQILGGKLIGTVTVDGHDVSNTPVQELAKSTGMLFQDPEWMFATLKVEDEIAFGPENLRREPDEILKSVEQSLNYVGMQQLRKNPVWALSGGQTQKLGLASVIAMQTPLIVLDEPTANLDPATTHAVHELILRLREEGRAVILVTKDLDEFMAEADDMILLANGRVIARGAPHDVVAEHGKKILELGVWLPETTEIGLRLKVLGKTIQQIPITVKEAVEVFANARFSRPQITARMERKDNVLIHAQNAEFAYSNKFKALRGVSFEIRQGEIAAIVGQNGAGKSTLAKLLVGLLRPTNGEITMFGRKSKQWTVQDLATQIALVFQNPEHQFLCDTVRQELEYSLLAQGIDDKTIVATRVQEMLKRLEITETSDSHPFSLSAGAKRRLGVATMLIAGSARLLIVDEPTYGQDRRLTESLMKQINNLRQGGITVLMITHDMRLVDAFVERAIVMANGQKIFDGSPDDLFQAPDVLERASLRATTLRRLVDGLRACGVTVPDGLNTVDEFIGAIQ